ncbi:MAG: hypothetical protein OXU79_13160 [Gemmatimonadota bacterium]|nr:hypothetical protein [Gemmatimonadota bacterium]
MFVLNLTRSQLESFELIWGSFTSFDWAFIGPGRTFGFYGRLGVDVAGRVDLLGLCVACSAKHTVDEHGGLPEQLREKLCSRSGNPAHEPADWNVEFMVSENAGGIPASHLLLGYGDSSDLRKVHFSRYESKAKDTDDPLTARNEYYPVSTSACPEAAREIAVSDLQSLVSQNPVVALTGAGISTGSGIPSFRGAKGLERHFPLHEPFPGAVAEFMIDRPQELARILARFQAAFIQAEPNDAHRALADLEERGWVRHVITGNGDKLHERAGSVNVQLKNSEDFKPGARGRAWLAEGNVLLAVGLGRDEHGLISYARDNGMQVVSVSPDRPEFLHREDLFVHGKAENVLPRLTGRK